MNHCLIGDCRDSMSQLIVAGVKAQMCVIFYLAVTFAMPSKKYVALCVNYTNCCVMKPSRDS